MFPLLLLSVDGFTGGPLVSWVYEIKGGVFVEEKLRIKTEYITTDTSYRKLAEKYGIRYATIQKWGQEEKWPELRNQWRIKTVSKTVEKIGEKQARQAAKVNDLADKLMLKLEQAIEELDFQVTTYKVKTETGIKEETTEYRTAAPGGIVDRVGLRQLTAALRELQAIKGEVTELERREREARIANLRKLSESNGDGKSSTVTVQLSGGIEDYAQ